VKLNTHRLWWQVLTVQVFHIWRSFLTGICKEIVNSTGCTKEDAQPLLVNALAYNIVVAEIVDKVRELYKETRVA